MFMKHASESTNTDINPNTDTAGTTSSCCGGPAPKDASACCALDATVKAQGGSGCGCQAPSATQPKKGCC